MRNVAVSAVLVFWLLPVFPAAAVCAPEELIKVVTSGDHPELPEDHFGRVPKTLYRVGDTRGRLEEQPNPHAGLHLLIVVDSPDLWVVDRYTNRGNYIIDQGPTYNFRAPLFRGAPVSSEFLKDLEIGCEITWLRDKGATEKSVKHPEFGEVTVYEYEEESDRILMYADNDKPLRVELYGSSGYITAINYVAYETGLAPRPDLFEKPGGVIFEAAQ